MKTAGIWRSDVSLGRDKASGAICTILYMNLQTQSISLLLGGVIWHAEHNYHQAQSIALFLPLGVSTDICPHFRHGREHACSLWKHPKLSQWKELPQWRCWGCPGSINLTLGSTVPNLPEPGPCE